MKFGIHRFLDFIEYKQLFRDEKEEKSVCNVGNKMSFLDSISISMCDFKDLPMRP